MGKIIALDFGLKRTGIAISDESQRIASGLQTIDSKTIPDFLSALMSQDKIDKIVLGIPYNLDGTPTHITQNVLYLKEVLEKKFPTTPILLHNEQFTSTMASQTIQLAGLKKKQRQNKALIDKISATIILQSFLAKEEY